jgi:hypothetical protein
MKKFLVTYHAPAEAMSQTMNVSPEQQAKGMEMWMNWMKKCGDKMIDMGAPLVNGQQISADGKLNKSNNNVSGYSIIQAENMEDAKALLEGHPHLSGWSKEATIEIHETRAIPGM